MANAILVGGCYQFPAFRKFITIFKRNPAFAKIPRPPELFFVPAPLLLFFFWRIPDFKTQFFHYKDTLLQNKKPRYKRGLFSKFLFPPTSFFLDRRSPRRPLPQGFIPVTQQYPQFIFSRTP